MEITKEKRSKSDTRNMIKKPKHTDTNSHQITKDSSMRSNNEFIKQKNNKISILHSLLSIITLKVNGLNFPIKNFKVVDWIKNASIFYVNKTHFSSKNIN